MMDLDPRHLLPHLTTTDPTQHHHHQNASSEPAHCQCETIGTIIIFAILVLIGLLYYIMMLVKVYLCCQIVYVVLIIDVSTRDECQVID